MSRYGVTAIHIDDQGRIVRVRMQAMNADPLRLVGEEREYAAHEAAGLISVGDTIISFFPVLGGGTIPGPKFKLAVYAHGVEGIELSEDVAGFQLQDMAQF